MAKLVERMVGITVPPRAAWLRALLAEQERIAHHLLWLSATAEVAEPTDSGAAVAAAAAAAAGFAARERLLDLLERYCGGACTPWSTASVAWPTTATTRGWMKLLRQPLVRRPLQPRWARRWERTIACTASQR